MVKRFAFLVMVLFAPAFADARLIITEIMYDPQGTDTGREWIEVYNDGSASVDMSNVFVYEEGVYHKMTLVSGAAGLQAGGYAVIADNSEKFKADYPSFNGTLFDSVFSLKNTGEMVAIREVDKAAETEIEHDQVLYDPAVGSKGDGSTLQRTPSGTYWSAGLVTPGSSLVQVIVSAESATSSESAATSSSAISGNSGSASTEISTSRSFVIEPQIFCKIKADTAAFTGGEKAFSADAWGLKKEPLPNARYLWNFGDGTLKEGRSVFHSYMQPGEYHVFLTVASAEYTAIDRMVVKVVPPDFVLWAREGYLEVENRSSVELDLFGLHVHVSDYPHAVFSFPEHTVLSAKGVGRFHFSLFEKVPEGLNQTWTLRYLSGIVVATSTSRGDVAVASIQPQKDSPIALNAAQNKMVASQAATVIAAKLASSGASSEKVSTKKTKDPEVISLGTIGAGGEGEKEKTGLARLAEDSPVKVYGTTALVLLFLVASGLYFFSAKPTLENKAF